MSMTLTEALKALDPASADHWTSDGSPRMDVLQELTGNKALTRAMVLAEAPTFSRESPLTEAPQDPGVSTASDQGTIAAPPQLDDEDEDEAEQTEEALTEPTEDEDALTAEIEAADAQLAEAEAQLAAHRRDIEIIRARRDRLIEERERERDANDDLHERLFFIRRQAEMRAQRAGVTQAAADLAMAARGQNAPSPLDQAMASRRSAPRALTSGMTADQE